MKNGSKDDYKDAVYDFDFITNERTKLESIRNNLSSANTIYKKMKIKIAMLVS